MSNTIPLPEPIYHQWRRKNMPWSLEFAFNSMCHATTDDSEVRTLHTADQIHAHAAAVSAAKDAEIAGLRERVRVLEDALRHVDDCLSINDYDDYVMLGRFDSEIVRAALEKP